MYVSADSSQLIVASTAPAVIVTELQSNGGSASQEFIELYNTTDTDIVFDDPAQPVDSQWKLLFYSATSVKNSTASGTPMWTNPVTTANTVVLKGTIPANEYFVVSPTGYKPGAIEVDQHYGTASSNLMTDSGGGLQLLQTVGSADTAAVTAHDRVMWLDAAANSPLPAGILASPTVGKSLQRLPNNDNEYAGPAGGLTEFAPAAAATPLDAWQSPAPVLPIPTTGSGGSDAGNEAEAEQDGETIPHVPTDNTGLVSPMITELLPNPATPLTDATDEYIELYNPNSTPFGLDGYSLEVGTSTVRSYSFDEDAALLAGSYKAYTSAETRLSLTNSGGQVRLRDTEGQIVSETTAYGAAGDNQAWTISEGVWKWTSTPTPGAPNVITAIAAKAVKAAATKKPATQKAAKTTKAKVATAKKVKAKKPAKKKDKKTKVATLASATSEKPKPPIHYGILVAVAVAAVLYGLYEYRNDISNRIHQFRQNRAARRHGRGQTAWRRGYSAE